MCITVERMSTTASEETKHCRSRSPTTTHIPCRRSPTQGTTSARKRSSDTGMTTTIAIGMLSSPSSSSSPRRRRTTTATATTPPLRRMVAGLPCWLLVLLTLVFLGNRGVTAQTTTTAPPTSSDSPTAIPVPAPTLAPSAVPTPSPTATPSVAPSTTRPTLRPTSEPSAQPTSRPTTPEPTAAPTSGPSWAPIIGTRSPVIATDMPTTAAPTTVPSASPTLGLQIIDLAALMFVEYMPAVLTRGEGIDFEVTTEAHIREWLRSTSFADAVDELAVATDVNQQTLLDTGRRLRQGLQGRHLEEDEDDNEDEFYTLQIEFVVRVAFRSVQTDFDMKTLVSDAFASDVQKNRYISRLKGSNIAFRLVSNVDFLIEGQSVPNRGSNTSNGKDDDVMLYIIAAAGGGCALVLAGLAYLYCSRRSAASSPGNKVKTKKKRDDITTSASDKSPLGLAAEIQVVKRPTGDDISTLGDPMPVLAVTPTPGDDNTASVGNDYDYSRDYRRAHGLASDQGSLERNGSVGSKTGNSASLFSSSDNTSIDMLAAADPKRVQRVEVTVPPGKLGIVMDNSPSGTPMVYAVKPESVLAHDVRIGDRLLSVDQEDVTIMSAVQVSKLISLKSDQYRVLVFGRKVEANGTAQDL